MNFMEQRIVDFAFFFCFSKLKLISAQSGFIDLVKTSHRLLKLLAKTSVVDHNLYFNGVDYIFNM